MEEEAPVPPFGTPTIPVTFAALPKILPDTLEPEMVSVGLAVGGEERGAVKAKDTT